MQMFHVNSSINIYHKSFATVYDLFQTIEINLRNAFFLSIFLILRQQNTPKRQGFTLSMY